MPVRKQTALTYVTRTTKEIR